MAQGTPEAQRHDDLRINVKKRHELNYWTNNFAISESKLKEAVNKVGPVVKDLRKYFQG